MGVIGYGLDWDMHFRRNMKGGRSYLFALFLTILTVSLAGESSEKASRKEKGEVVAYFGLSSGLVVDWAHSVGMGKLWSGLCGSPSLCPLSEAVTGAYVMHLLPGCLMVRCDTSGHRHATRVTCPRGGTVRQYRYRYFVYLDYLGTPTNQCKEKKKESKTNSSSKSRPPCRSGTRSSLAIPISSFTACP